MNWRTHNWACATTALLLACGHSDTFTSPAAAAGPFNGGADVRLTLNSDQDYWPTWSEDGRGILYSFINAAPGPQHRCLGLLPAAGGMQIWKLCDDRATQADSVNSFSAYALGADGRLLYVEAVSQSGAQSAAPSVTTLWLADSAAPMQRRALLRLPGFAGATPVAWLADLNWTGPTTFIALAQDFSILGHCKNCGAVDSTYYGQAVVRGTISGTSATLQVVPGTSGASGYSLAENGASIVFTLRDDRQLYKVAATGGTAAVVAIVTPVGGTQLLGVSCRGSTCVVAADPVTLSAATEPVTFPGISGFTYELRGVSLVTGAVQVLRSTAALVATPQVSPANGDVVAQVGGAFGHLQTFTSSGSDLHLYQGLVP